MKEISELLGCCYHVGILVT